MIRWACAIEELARALRIQRVRRHGLHEGPIRGRAVAADSSEAATNGPPWPIGRDDVLGLGDQGLGVLVPAKRLEHPRAQVAKTGVGKSVGARDAVELFEGLGEVLP